MAVRLPARGTSLVELLAAVVFIGLSAAVILGCVSSSVSRSAYAKRRSLALAQAKAEIELAKANGRTAAPTTGTVSSNPAISGFGATVTQSRTIALVTGFTNLYSMRVTISWSERSFGSPRTDSITLDTLMRCPDA